MRHSIGYLGWFDRSFPNLRAGVREYVREDGAVGKVDDRPEDVNGVFFGYMERPGKTFVAVRAHYEEIDVVLATPVPLDSSRHTDGKGFGPIPSRFGDESASRLLADMIAANPQIEEALRQIRDQLRLQ